MMMMMITVEGMSVVVAFNEKKTRLLSNNTTVCTTIRHDMYPKPNKSVIAMGHFQ
jgi:hypothetical protein